MSQDSAVEERIAARVAKVAQENGTAVEVAEAYAAEQPEISRTRQLTWQDPMPTAAAGATMTGMEYMRAIVAGELPPPPIAVTMRMRPIELGEGRAVFEGEPGEEHYNPIGVVHGGYAATLLDSALGCAVHTTLPAGVGYTSLGLEAKYVRPITRDTGRVLCEANVLYGGRRQATVEANLTAAESGKLLAHGIATCMILAS
ncbi:MAG TPA: PaaI family thioesterase [Solirubrobacterales bacterium]|nr:PaaI family thioesterase [Solirubrobacterales bacterium]